MKLAIFLTAMFLVAMPASAGPNEKIKLQPEMLEDVLEGVIYLAKDCEFVMSSALFVNGLDYRDAKNSKERTLLRNKQSIIIDDATKCIKTNKSKISELSEFIVTEMKKRNLLELSKNYIVQALTMLDATKDEKNFPAEHSKLVALKNRIDLELSLAKNK